VPSNAQHGYRQHVGAAGAPPETLRYHLFIARVARPPPLQVAIFFKFFQFAQFKTPRRGRTCAAFENILLKQTRPIGASPLGEVARRKV